MSARLTPIADVVPGVLDRMTGRAELPDRHVEFLRRHARIATNNRARSIGAEMEAIAERLDGAIRAGQLVRIDPVSDATPPENRGGSHEKDPVFRERGA
jgi:hypothetical protein